MALVPLTLDIEEVAFIQVMRVLNGLPGVAKVHFDLDQIGGKRGGKHGPRQAKAQMNGARKGLGPLIVEALLGRPHNYAEIKQLGVDAGYKANSASQALNDMRKGGIVERDELSNWSLTKAARAKLEATEGEAVERAALPAPDASKPKKERKKRGGSPSAHLLIVVALRQQGKPMSRLALRDKLAAKGFSPHGIDGALAKAKSLGWIETVGPGIHKLTKNGRALKLPPETGNEQ